MGQGANSDCKSDKDSIFRYVTVNPTKHLCLSVHSPLAITNNQVFQKAFVDKNHKTHKEMKSTAVLCSQCSMQNPQFS